MLTYLLAGVAALFALGLISLMCGLLRSATASSRLIEEQDLWLLAEDDEQRLSQAQAERLSSLRTAS